LKIRSLQAACTPSPRGQNGNFLFGVSPQNRFWLIASLLPVQQEKILKQSGGYDQSVSCD